MKFTEIRNTVISRMTAQTIIDGKDVLYPNGPTFDPSGKLIWARLSNIPGQAGVNEIGAGPVVYRTGIIIIQLFVPAGSGSKLITETADKLRELFEFQDDDRLSYQAVSSIAVGEKNGWFQLKMVLLVSELLIVKVVMEAEILPMPLYTKSLFKMTARMERLALRQ